MNTRSAKPTPSKSPSKQNKDQPSEQQLDEAIEESFPASDPIAVSVPSDNDKKHPASKPAPAKKP